MKKEELLMPMGKEYERTEMFLLDLLTFLTHTPHPMYTLTFVTHSGITLNLSWKVFVHIKPR